MVAETLNFDPSMVASFPRTGRILSQPDGEIELPRLSVFHGAMTTINLAAP
jgi:hypothetical protein